MSKKDSSVLKLKGSNLKNKLSIIYSNFKSQLHISLKKNNFLVAVSGGPDSLALSALSKIYSKENDNKVFYALVDHRIRPNSGKEALAVKNLLKKKENIFKYFKK